jgi:tRNA pseudouridine65 synthase
LAGDNKNNMLDILYLDDYLAIVNKPAGWLVHRTPLDKGETRFVLQTLRDQIGQHVWNARVRAVMVVAHRAEPDRHRANQGREHQAGSKKAPKVQGFF